MLASAANLDTLSLCPSAAVAHFYTPQEYLSSELGARALHEYVDGYVYAMVEESEDHDRTAQALGAALFAHAQANGARLDVGGTKVRLGYGRGQAFYYPDVVMSCHPRDSILEYIQSPCLIAEVPSASTERIDRAEKLLAYQSIPSLESYLVIWQDVPCVEVHRREGGWRRTRYTQGEIRLPCLGEVGVRIEDLYAGLAP